MVQGGECAEFDWGRNTKTLNMIPHFDNDGDLLHGIHQTTWQEFQSRYCIFALTDRRLKLCEAIEQLVIAARASIIVEQLIFAGSFVTSKEEPNDFDAIIIFQSSVDVTMLAPFQLDLVDGTRAKRRFGGDLFPIRSGTTRVSNVLSFFSITGWESQSVWWR